MSRHLRLSQVNVLDIKKCTATLFFTSYRKLTNVLQLYLSKCDSLFCYIGVYMSTDRLFLTKVLFIIKNQIKY